MNYFLTYSKPNVEFDLLTLVSTDDFVTFKSYCTISDYYNMLEDILASDIFIVSNNDNFDFYFQLGLFAASHFIFESNNILKLKLFDDFDASDLLAELGSANKKAKKIMEILGSENKLVLRLVTGSDYILLGMLTYYSIPVVAWLDEGESLPECIGNYAIISEYIKRTDLYLNPAELQIKLILDPDSICFPLTKIK